jgi:hypothetical protein
VNDILDMLKIRPKINHPHFHAEYLWADAICINPSDLTTAARLAIRRGIVPISSKTRRRGKVSLFLFY